MAAVFAAGVPVIRGVSRGLVIGAGATVAEVGSPGEPFRLTSCSALRKGRPEASVRDARDAVASCLGECMPKLGTSGWADG